MSKQIHESIVELALSYDLWEGSPESRNRLYSINGPGDSDCPNECAYDLMNCGGMVELVFEDGKVIDVIRSDLLTGWSLSCEHHGVHTIDWDTVGPRLLADARNNDTWAKGVIRDMVLFAAYGESYSKGCEVK